MQHLRARLLGVIVLFVLIRWSHGFSDHAFVYGSSLSTRAPMFLENLTSPGQVEKDPEQIPLQPPKGRQITLSKIDIKMMLKYAILKPGPGQILFYSSRAGDAAKKLVKKRNKHGLHFTLWDIWPEEFYDGVSPDSRFYNLLAGCRYHFALTQEAQKANEANYHRTDAYKYFQIMSATLAYLADGKATIMSKTPDNIPQDGIWALTEFPTLTRRIMTRERPAYGAVNQIDVIHENGAFSQTLWIRPGPTRQQYTNNVTISSVEPDLACPGRPREWPQYLIDFWDGHDVEG